MPEKRFEGKVAPVTGPARGIGAAIARRLAADGARVVVNDSKSEDAAERRADHGPNWLNRAFLAVVGLLPSSTRLIANDHTEPLALAALGGNLSRIGLSPPAVGRHATAGRRPVDQAMPDAAVFGCSRCLVGAVGYGRGAALAFVSTPLAQAAFAAVPLLSILAAVPRAWMGMFGL